MRKIISLLGYTFLALIAAMAITVSVLYLEGRKLDKESRVFADSTIVALTSDWSVDELRKRASPEFESDVDFDEIQEYLDSLEELGTFVSYQGSTGESTITLSPRYGYEITADYTGTANFEVGSAEIQLLLIKQEGRWQILDFRVTPQMFTENKSVV
jgi:hypothetical protein